MLVLHDGDGISVRAFGCLMPLLPLLGILPGAVDLLMSTIFNSTNMLLLALAF